MGVQVAISRSTLHPHHISSGVIQLIIEAYTEEVLRELSSQPDFRLTTAQYALFRQKMNDLYDHIRHHPALHQRYLWVGKGRPDIDPDIQMSIREEKQNRGSSKRKRYLNNDSPEPEVSQPSVSKKIKSSYPAEEICKTNRLWEQINITHDFYDNEVEVIQDNVQQYVFSYRCVTETGPCIGISPLYESECTERYGWMYMYYRKLDDPFRIPQWGFVAAPHHCACKIIPKYIPES
ncbi:uncharacterized protein LOC129231739 [Uloborus diversus]|uniref:uncharacterized protein LOC129231739 n=1 Tax=Uloborus diversus TaxID=327109 RepID=UPI00240A1825|nr:uncharacterized protein LOC129231739 [Uloborus diversus]